MPRLPLQPRAFTLVELLVVILILVAIAGVVVSNLGSFTSEAQEKAVDVSLRRIQSAFVGPEGYAADLDYVADLDTPADGVKDPVARTLNARGVMDLLQQPGFAPEFDPVTKKGWRGPYLQPQGTSVDLTTLHASFAAYVANGQPAILDPWLAPIVVQRPSAVASANLVEQDRFTRLVSAGPNGQIETNPDLLTPAAVRQDLADNNRDDVVLFLFAE